MGLSRWLPKNLEAYSERDSPVVKYMSALTRASIAQGWEVLKRLWEETDCVFTC